MSKNLSRYAGAILSVIAVSGCQTTGTSMSQRVDELESRVTRNESEITRQEDEFTASIAKNRRAIEKNFQYIHAVNNALGSIDIEVNRDKSGNHQFKSEGKPADLPEKLEDSGA